MKVLTYWVHRVCNEVKKIYKFACLFVLAFFVLSLTFSDLGLAIPIHVTVLGFPQQYKSGLSMDYC